MMDFLWAMNVVSLFDFSAHLLTTETVSALQAGRVNTRHFKLYWWLVSKQI